MPNGGGLFESEAQGIGVPISSRKNIVVKTYGGTFGRGGLAIEAVRKVMEKDSTLTAYFYSVTEDLLGQVLATESRFKGRIGFSTLKKPTPHKELDEIFKISKIYIGCSISDGISTSFLEALTKRVYPIQTDTSCAREWLDKGVIASLVTLDLDKISNTLVWLLSNTEYIENAVNTNFIVASNELSSSKLAKVASVFYRIK